MTKGDHIQASAKTIPASAPAGESSRMNGWPVNTRTAWESRPKVGS